MRGRGSLCVNAGVRMETDDGVGDGAGDEVEWVRGWEMGGGEREVMGERDV